VRVDLENFVLVSDTRSVLLIMHILFFLFPLAAGSHQWSIQAPIQKDVQDGGKFLFFTCRSIDCIPTNRRSSPSRQSSPFSNPCSDSGTILGPRRLKSRFIHRPTQRL
jgi:hypothetical protein